MTARITLLALHGFTLNGDVMRAGLGELAVRLQDHVELVCPDAPHPCSPGAVDRLYAAWGAERLPPPHRCWWEANDDASVYHGWEQTLDMLRGLIAQHAPAAVLGFSQGAMLAATLAALSSRGELPPLAFAIMVAGSLPRAPVLRRAFDEAVNVPSLHVWGERDQVTGAGSPLLAERFAPAAREIVTWPGSHQIPTRGSAAEHLMDFVAHRARAASA